MSDYTTIENFNKLLEKIVRAGVDVEMTMLNDRIVYNLNTDMKSHLFVWFNVDESRAEYSSRYDDGYIDNEGDLLSIVDSCQAGRDYGNPRWFEILYKNSL